MSTAGIVPIRSKWREDPCRKGEASILLHYVSCLQNTGLSRELL
jgi:predicted ferric reductase